MGGQKKHAKGRLDKYYHLAKEHGYRSRAAFKLIQLNKKYDFLSKAKVVVDLCAAPGGWLQVAAKYMPAASIKIGVDLDPIKSIKGCMTFQCDITTPKCLAIIKKELKHFSADIVLNDGAPNVGTDWNLDAYNQIELSLHALKLATQVLRKGGIFITKVFRSKDYNSLLYVCNQLFNKVESSKPASSRSQSAEIFMVCQGFKAPDFIDPKFLDPKYALADAEEGAEEIDSGVKITSLKKLLDVKKRNRGGYDVVRENLLYDESDMWDFLESQDPYEYLTKCNKLIMDQKAKDALANTKGLKLPVDLEDIIADLKVSGRREFQHLLKLRHKYQFIRDNETRDQMKAAREAVPVKEKTEEEKEAELDVELDETIARIAAQRKRQEKKDRVAAAKSDIRKKMSVIASSAIENDEDLTLSKRLWEKVRTKGFENVGDKTDSSSEDDSDMSDEKVKVESEKSEEEEAADSEESDGVNSEQNRIEEMANEMDEAIEKQGEYRLAEDKKAERRKNKNKKLVEQQRQRVEDMSEDEALGNRDLLSDDKEGKGSQESENDDDLESSDEGGEAGLFVNPLNKKKENEKEEQSEEWSDDDDEKVGDDGKGGPKVNKGLLGKRKRGGIGDMEDFFKNEEIEEVPADDVGTKKAKGYDSDDSDEVAELRLMAKKMLRKKTRDRMVEDSYNRYTFNDEASELPQWFVADETKYFRPFVNLTKEEVAIEKDIIKAYNARPSKKVEEAKNRKRKKLGRAMQKIKKKAVVIADQDINEASKMKQIQKLYKKEKAKHKEEKTYVVNRTFKSSQGLKSGRNVKMVDSRMKKDQRNEKFRHKGTEGKKKLMLKNSRAKPLKGRGRKKA